MASRLLAAAVFIGAFVPQQGVRIEPILVPGDEFRLRATYVREYTARPEWNQTVRTTIHVRVHSAGPLGYVIDWRPTVERLEGVGGKPDPIMAMVAGLLTDLPFRLQLDPDGALAGAVNAPELMNRFEQVRTQALERAAKELRDMAAADREKVDATLRALLDPAVLVPLTFRDADAYLAMNGLSLQPGSPVASTFERPSPLGEGTLSGVQTVALESASPDLAVVTRKTSVDRASLMKAAAGVLALMGERVPEELLQQSAVDVVDETRLVFDRRLGLVREIKGNRGISASLLRHKEQWTVELTSEPKRLAGAGERFEAIRLESIANAPLNWLTQPPAGQKSFGGIPFALGDGERAVFTTRDHFHQSMPNQRTLKTNLANVVGVHVLVTGGWIAHIKPGVEVGQIRLVFDNGRTLDHALIAGGSIREGWEPIQNTSRPSDPRWKNVWSEEQLRGQEEALGFLDLLSLDIPDELRTRTLTAIDFIDKGTVHPDTRGKALIDPSISVVGVTVRLRAVKQ